MNMSRMINKRNYVGRPIVTEGSVDQSINSLYKVNGPVHLNTGLASKLFPTQVRVVRRVDIVPDHQPDISFS